VTTYPPPFPGHELRTPATDATRARRILACARALKAIARNWGHHEHALAVDRDLALGDTSALFREERAWHELTARCFGLLLGAAGVGEGDDDEGDEREYQAVLDDVFETDEGQGGDDGHD